jgi:hypothetical protein
VIRNLEGRGHHVVAVADPQRDLHTDAAYMRSVLDSVTGPVVLTGHSDGGSVLLPHGSPGPPLGRPGLRAGL